MNTFQRDDFPVRVSGDIQGGRAFNMKVTIHFRLFGPY